MLGTLEVEQTDIERLKGIAQRAGIPLNQAFHEAVDELEQCKTLIDDEHDPDEKAFNDAVRSPEVRRKLKQLDELLVSKGL